MKKPFESEERTGLALQSLYEKYGYQPYKMRKFEEYDLYAGNKSFLISENVLTFTDPGGKLMALKPDVTLSVVRSCRQGEEKKICYGEKVYRPGRDGSFKEITQVGVENVGKIDLYAVCEVLSLALSSLLFIAGDARLCISDTRLFSFFADKATSNAALREELKNAFTAKNRKEILSFAKRGCDVRMLDRLAALSSLDGAPCEVFPSLYKLSKDRAYVTAVKELQTLAEVLDSPAVFIDASVTGDLDYYGGVIFRGYIPGVGESVLSGGQYDPLMRKMGKNQSALGFAVCLDSLPPAAPAKYDADLLILYGEDSDPGTVLREVKKETARGKTVYAARTAPAGFTAKSVLDLKAKED